MAYKCSQCGAVSQEAGNCPHCNVPMEEVKEGEAAQPGQTTEAQPNPGQ